MLGVAAPLTIADIVTKEVMPTAAWAHHQRSPGWLLLCCVVFVGLFAICRVPALLVPPAAGLLAAGVLGNGLSAAMHRLRVPNPLVVESNTTIVAFNLADVWAVAGIASLTAVVAIWLIRNRRLLPAHRRAAASEERGAMTEDGNTAF